MSYNFVNFTSRKLKQWKALLVHGWRLADITRMWYHEGQRHWVSRLNPLPLPESTMTWEITLATEDLYFCATISVFALNPSSNLHKSLGSSYLQLGSPFISCDEKSYDSTEILNFPKTEPDTFTLLCLPHPHEGYLKKINSSININSVNECRKIISSEYFLLVLLDKFRSLVQDIPSRPEYMNVCSVPWFFFIRCLLCSRHCR